MKYVLLTILFIFIGVGAYKTAHHFQAIEKEDLIVRAFISNEDNSIIRRSFRKEIVDQIHKLNSTLGHENENIPVDSLRELLKESWALFIQTDQLFNKDEITYYYDSIMFSVLS